MASPRESGRQAESLRPVFPHLCSGYARLASQELAFHQACSGGWQDRCGTFRRVHVCHEMDSCHSWMCLRTGLEITAMITSHEQSSNVASVSCSTGVCKRLTAHDSRASGPCTALTEWGCPLSLEKTHVATTSRCVSPGETKPPWREAAAVIANSYFCTQTSLEMPIVARHTAQVQSEVIAASYNS